MGRKVYFFVILFVLNSYSWGWNSFAARIGRPEPVPYQSSNPTVELRTTRNINQQQSQECYLFAFAGSIEVANLNGWNRPLSPEISPEYLFVQKLLDWAYQVLTNQSTLDDTLYFLDGGDVHHAMKLSIDHGLLPQSYFRPAIPFEEWDFPLLYREIKEIAKEGRKVLASTRNPETQKQILEMFLQKIQSRLALQAGMTPQQFTWGGRNWTPRSFENAYGIKRNSHIFMMYPKGSWDMGDPFDLRKTIIGMVDTFKGAFNYQQSNWSQIWQYLMGSVDKGLPVLLSLKWAGTYHVLNVVGYEYNNQGQIVSFKLKNSWSEDYGDKGHAYFGLQDIQKYTTSVWGFKSP